MKLLKKLVLAMAKNPKNLPLTRGVVLDGMTARGVVLDAGGNRTGITVVCSVHGLHEPILVSCDTMKQVLAVADDAPLAYTDGRLGGVPLPEADVSEYPTMPTVMEVPVLTRVDLRELERASSAMADGDIRYYLNGMLLDLPQQRIVATDGHRMTVIDTTLPMHDAPLIIPRAAIMLFTTFGVDMLGVAQTADGVRLLGTGAHGVRVLTQPIDGRFPDYAKVIPAERRAVVIDPWSMLPMVKKLAAYQKNQKYQGIKVRSDGGEVQLVASDDSLILPTPCRSNGAVNVGLDARYLRDALEAVGPGGTLHLDGPGDAVKLMKDQTTVVVMPMRV